MSTPAHVEDIREHANMHTQFTSLKNLLPDPQHAFRDWGILVSQSEKEEKFKWELDAEYSGYENTWAVYEISEAYIRDVIWEEIEKSETNHTSENETQDISYTNTNATTVTTEKSFKSGLGLEGKGIKFEIGGETKTINTSISESKKEVTSKVTLRPGETLYVYQRVIRFYVRKWWILKQKETESVVANHRSEDTSDAYVEGRSIQGTTRSVTPVTETEFMKLSPVAKKYSDVPGSGYPRSIHQELPDSIQLVLNHYWDVGRGHEPKFPEDVLGEMIMQGAAP